MLHFALPVPYPATSLSKTKFLSALGRLSSTANWESRSLSGLVQRFRQEPSSRNRFRQTRQWLEIQPVPCVNWRVQGGGRNNNNQHLRMPKNCDRAHGTIGSSRF